MPSLASCGFFRATPWAQVAHLPRYLTALERRLAKWPADPARDARHSAMIEKWWERYRERPPRFEYRLTEKGHDLYGVIVTVADWGDKHMAGRKGPPVERVDFEAEPVWEVAARECERVAADGAVIAQVRASKPPKPGSTLHLEDAFAVEVLGREGGFALVWSDPYLRWIALLTVLSIARVSTDAAPLPSPN